MSARPDVVFLQPVYPPEMQQFARGLSEAGARVWGVGDSSEKAIPDSLGKHLSGYLRVPRIMDEDDVIRRVEAWLGGRRPDAVEACWEGAPSPQRASSQTVQNPAREGEFHTPART